MASATAVRDFTICGRVSECGSREKEKTYLDSLLFDLLKARGRLLLADHDV
jgi:hypothetical protein